MLIKTLTLHSLTYVVGITSSVVVHQVIASDAAARFDPGMTAIINQHIVNRAIKSDRLRIEQAKPRVNGKALIRAPAQITSNPKFKTDCQPIDILGRCFADAGVNHKVA